MNTERQQQYTQIFKVEEVNENQHNFYRLYLCSSTATYQDLS